MPIAEASIQPAAAIKFQGKHGTPPSHMINYDDGDLHASRISESQNGSVAMDEDGDKLQCRGTAVKSISGGGFTIEIKHTAHKTAVSLPAGCMTSSFTAEIRAGILAFQTARNTVDLTNCRIRWILDCLSVCKALQGTKKSSLIYELSNQLQSITQDFSASIYIV